MYKKGVQCWSEYLARLLYVTDRISTILLALLCLCVVPEQEPLTGEQPGMVRLLLLLLALAALLAGLTRHRSTVVNVDNVRR